jgi:hypothetical protein
LIGFASARSGKAPSALTLADLDAPAITAFLPHLQDDRGNSARTRNARLAAVRSLFAYAALRHPEHGALIQRPGSPNKTASPATRCSQDRPGRDCPATPSNGASGSITSGRPPAARPWPPSTSPLTR